MTTLVARDGRVQVAMPGPGTPPPHQVVQRAQRFQKEQAASNGPGPLFTDDCQGGPAPVGNVELMLSATLPRSEHAAPPVATVPAGPVAEALLFVATGSSTSPN